jgi:hypothetical protein
MVAGRQKQIRSFTHSASCSGSGWNHATSGAERIEATNPGDPRPAPLMRSRRSTFERALRLAAPRQLGLSLCTGHVDGLVIDGGQVTGVRVDGSSVEADLVVDAPAEPVAWARRARAR